MVIRFRVFDDPEMLDLEIQKKAKEKDSALSRVLATYDWEYSQKRKPDDRLRAYWEVSLENGTSHGIES